MNTFLKDNLRTFKIQSDDNVYEKVDLNFFAYLYDLKPLSVSSIVN